MNCFCLLIGFNLTFHGLQTELISGDQNGNIRVWDLTANSCSCELVSASTRIFNFTLTDRIQNHRLHHIMA